VPAWDNPSRPDSVVALEQHIDLVLSSYESGTGTSWVDFEQLLTEGYGRLLAVEAICVRLEAQLDGDGSTPAGGRTAAERQELEEFRQALKADAANLRDMLAHFKARGLEARRRRSSQAA
jgi:hypothetical protein